jgi:hypothetical protein
MLHEVGFGDKRKPHLQGHKESVSDLMASRNYVPMKDGGGDGEGVIESQVIINSPKLVKYHPIGKHHEG